MINRFLRHGWRLPRRTIRLRLTLIYGGMIVISGLALLVLTYVLLTDQQLIGFAPGTTATPADQHVVTSTNRPPEPAGSQFGRISPTPQVLYAVGLAMAIMIVISIGLGWWMAGRMLRPLRTIISTVRESSANSLHRRLALTGPEDELKELGDTFDELLDRLATSFNAQRQFVANASHELRTPLSRARTLLEVALRDPTTDLASLRATCTRAIAAGEQQERLIEALLTLARSERGLDHRRPVALESVAHTLLLSHKPIADREGLRLDAQLEPATTMGDTQLLERMIANLLDNALRYNHPGGSVRIRTQVKAGHPTLSVANSGPVIPADDLDRLRQPFQRGGARRTDNGEGLGLGLSIIEAIATAHGATTSARSQPQGGLELEIRFPPDPRPRMSKARPAATEKHPPRR